MFKKEYHVIDKGRFFDEVVELLEERADGYLVKFLGSPRTLIVQPENLKLRSEHDKDYTDIYNVCRYIIKRMQDKLNTVPIHRLSVRTMIMLMNYNYYELHQKPLLPEKFRYELYKLGYFNQYVGKALRECSYGSHVLDFQYDNHIPVIFNEEQKQFIDEQLDVLSTLNPSLAWPVFSDMESEWVESKSYIQEFIEQYSYDRNVY